MKKKQAIIHVALIVLLIALMAGCTDPTVALLGEAQEDFNAGQYLSAINVSLDLLKQYPESKEAEAAHKIVENSYIKWLTESLENNTLLESSSIYSSILSDIPNSETSKLATKLLEEKASDLMEELKKALEYKWQDVEEIRKNIVLISLDSDINAQIDKIVESSLQELNKKWQTALNDKDWNNLIPLENQIMGIKLLISTIF